MTSPINIVRRDQARAQYLKQSRAKKLQVNNRRLVSNAGVSALAGNQAVVYTVNVSIMLSSVIQRALIWLYVGHCWHSHYYM